MVTVRTSQFLTFKFVCVPLPGQSVEFMFQLLHLRDQAGLLVLQNVFLLDALEAAGLCVTSVFQGPAFLLETHHLVLA